MPPSLLEIVNSMFEHVATKSSTILQRFNMIENTLIYVVDAISTLFCVTQVRSNISTK